MVRDTAEQIPVSWKSVVKISSLVVLGTIGNSLRLRSKATYKKSKLARSAIVSSSASASTLQEAPT
jgi:hypothetical protein